MLLVVNEECGPDVFHNVWHKKKIIKKNEILVCVYMLLGTEPRTLCLLGKHSTTELKKPMPKRYLRTQVW